MRVPVVLLLIAAAALPLFAQHREEITVEVVDVPVYVRRGGEPVAGLTRENFELFVNGKPQPIDYFDVIDFGEAAPPSEPAPMRAARALQPRRLFLFVFDLYFSTPPAIARAKKAAMSLVLQGGAADFYAVAKFTSGGGVRVVSPFTSNREAIARAIVTLQHSEVNDPLRMSVARNEREALQSFTADSVSGEFFGGITSGKFSAGGGGRGDRGAAEIVDPETGGGRAMDDNRLRPIQRVAELQVNDLRATGRRLAPLAGQKHVVLLSEGFPVGFFIDPQHASSYMHECVQRLYKEYHASGTFLHALDIKGLRHTFTAMTNDTLRILSRETGGEFLQNTNSLGLALTKLAERHRYQYLLGFTPRAPRRGYNRIVIRLKDVEGRAQLSYRRGFSNLNVEITR